MNASSLSGTLSRDSKSPVSLFFESGQLGENDDSKGPASQVLAAVDDIARGGRILKHAEIVANSLGLQVAAARVFETDDRPGNPVDPLEWQARRREERNRLDRLIDESATDVDPQSRFLLTGRAGEEISAWARSRGSLLIALGTRDHGGGETGLGATAHAILYDSDCSVLLVPPTSRDEPRLRRLLVPLDGSCRAESVLPVAVRIARSAGAEIILAHVVPQSEILGNGGDSEQLQLRLCRQNERNARAYLHRLETRFWKEQLAVRSMVIAEGDVRRSLQRLGNDLHADLIVMAAHGRGGMKEMACGSVAEYLATHAPAPLLILRSNFTQPKVEATARLAPGKPHEADAFAR